ncbi:MAG TPA: hypothetical protein IGS17_19575 [Oscillatoriales cyanobacterium M59_W2019_021]|nr:hypothetical protein [Oscillatoriales cyanobacterium M4454_W2019_049]HIK53096.1 hypothetical protein [Oscillatoriales cyanobacterium M59_W2019_021]
MTNRPLSSPPSSTLSRVRSNPAIPVRKKSVKSSRIDGKRTEYSDSHLFQSIEFSIDRHPRTPPAERI